MLRALDHANEEAWEEPLFSFSLHQEHRLICRRAHVAQKLFKGCRSRKKCADAVAAYLLKENKNQTTCSSKYCHSSDNKYPLGFCESAG